MTTRSTYPVDNDNLVMAYRTQTEWNWLITFAFFFGGLGGGLFMVSLFTDYFAAAVAGWLIAVVGKGTAHFLYLGKPLRFWRAVTRPQTSWISRGIIAMLGLGGFGFLYLLVRGGVVGTEGSPLQTVFAVVAGISALVVMVYDGFVLATPPSIALWHSALLPVVAGAYSLLGGTTFTLFLFEAGVGSGTVATEALHRLELGLVVFNLVILLLLLGIGWSASTSAKESVRLLLRRFGWQFLGGVVAVGLLATGLISLAAAGTTSVGVLLVIAACELVGDFLVWFTVLHVGVYAPVISRARFAR